MTHDGFVERLAIQQQHHGLFRDIADELRPFALHDRQLGGADGMGTDLEGPPQDKQGGGMPGRQVDG